MIAYSAQRVKLNTQKFRKSYYEITFTPLTLRICQQGIDQKFDLYESILTDNFPADCKVDTQIIPNSSICLLDKSGKVVYTVGESGGKWGKREQKGQNLAFISTATHYPPK